MDSDALYAAHFISLRSSNILSNVVTQSSVSRGMITRATPLRTLSTRRMFPWIGAGGVTNLNQGRIMAHYKAMQEPRAAKEAVACASCGRPGSLQRADKARDTGLVLFPMSDIGSTFDPRELITTFDRTSVFLGANRLTRHPRLRYQLASYLPDLPNRRSYDV